uniref:Uncharacterized protein n=1 Tax=Amphimedon queenslandica TaxID=400682 RepID=A0A1X7TLK0_AMPQE
KGKTDKRKQRVAPVIRVNGEYIKEEGLVILVTIRVYMWVYGVMVITGKVVTVTMVIWWYNSNGYISCLWCTW